MTDSDCAASATTAEQVGREKEEEEEGTKVEQKSEDDFDLLALAEEFEILHREAGLALGLEEQRRGDGEFQRSSTSRVQTVNHPVPQSRHTLPRTATIPAVPMKIHIDAPINCHDLSAIEEQVETCGLSPSDDQILHPLRTLQQQLSATPHNTNVTCDDDELLSSTCDRNEEVVNRFDQELETKNPTSKASEVQQHDETTRESNIEKDLQSDAQSRNLDQYNLEAATATATEDCIASSVPQDSSKPSCNKVVVVVDGEKKTSTTALDWALKNVAKQEDDEITIIAFLKHVISPMGNQTVADVNAFGGVNAACLEQAIASTKQAIENNIKDTGRCQFCDFKRIKLEVKVAPGGQPLMLVVQEIEALQTTCVVIDRNAHVNKKYLSENLTCRAVQMKPDGCSTEDICLLDHSQFSGTLSKHSGRTLDSSNKSSNSFWNKIGWSFTSSYHHTNDHSFQSRRSSSSSEGQQSPVSGVLLNTSPLSPLSPISPNTCQLEPLMDLGIVGDQEMENMSWPLQTTSNEELIPETG